MKILKWFAGGVGVIIVVGHLGIVGHLLNKEGPKVVKTETPRIDYPPVGDYSSYTVKVNPDGSYSVDYKRHDPTVLGSDTYVDKSNGVFGIGGRSTTTRSRQYVPGTQSETHTGVDGEGKPVRSEECIKAEGGGESSGALVGASVATSIVPLVTNIPYIGFLASGWLLMLGQDVGSSVGSEIASTIKGC
jgi:hypothetical protein